MRQPEIKKTLMFLGPSEVGKTTIRNQLLKHKYFEQYLPTFGADYDDGCININQDCNIRLCCWDTHGAELLTPVLIDKIYQGCDAFILVWSYDRKESFNDLVEWVRFIIRKKNANPNLIDLSRIVPIVIIVNKSDIKDKQFTIEELNTIIRGENHDIQVCEMSAQDKTRIDLLFKHIGNKLLGLDNNNENTFFIKNGRMLNDNASQVSKCPSCC